MAKAPESEKVWHTRSEITSRVASSVAFSQSSGTHKSWERRRRNLCENNFHLSQVDTNHLTLNVSCDFFAPSLIYGESCQPSPQDTPTVNLFSGKAEKRFPGGSGKGEILLLFHSAWQNILFSLFIVLSFRLCTFKVFRAGGKALEVLNWYSV